MCSCHPEQKLIAWKHFHCTDEIEVRVNKKYRFVLLVSFWIFFCLFCFHQGVAWVEKDIFRGSSASEVDHRVTMREVAQFVDTILHFIQLQGAQPLPPRWEVAEIRRRKKKKKKRPEISCLNHRFPSRVSLQG